MNRRFLWVGLVILALAAAGACKSKEPVKAPEAGRAEAGRAEAVKAEPQKAPEAPAAAPAAEAAKAPEAAKAEAGKPEAAKPAEEAKAPDAPAPEAASGVDKDKLSKAYTDVYCAQKKGDMDKILGIYKNYGFNTPAEFTKAWIEAAKDTDWVTKIAHEVSKRCL